MIYNIEIPTVRYDFNPFGKSDGFNKKMKEYQDMPLTYNKKQNMKQVILDAISDLCANFLFNYNRKECECLTVDHLKEAVANGEITIDEIVSLFREELEESLNEN